VPVEQWGEKTAAAFLGVRLECAQCHKHPFDRWTQADYRSYANVFTRVGFGLTPDSLKAFQAENQTRIQKKPVKKGFIPLTPLREVFVAMPVVKGPAPAKSGKSVKPVKGVKPVKPVQVVKGVKGAVGVRPSLLDPATNRPLPAKALGGPEIPLQPGQDPREALFAWMRSGDNPFFARSFANRVWGHYFGVGIVHPVDDFSLANPPSNPKLLEALARDFAEGHYDIRRLERAILNSRTYQLSSKPNASNRFDHINYAHSYVRPLLAEVVVDVINTAVGVQEKDFGPGTPQQCRAIEVGASRLQNPAVMYAFRVFGRPPRTTACDCERAMEPALPQKLFLIADPTVQAKLRAPQNRLRTLLAEKADDDEALDELFLATLARLPNARERETFAEYRAAKKDRQAAFADTLWALINTTEFIFNH